MNIIYKTILIKFLIFLGIFITVNSTVIFAILAILLPNISSYLTYLTWVSNLYALHLNILIIGLGLLIGGLIFEHFNPSHDIMQKIKDRIHGENIRKYRILLKSGSFVGALIASYTFGYFLSFIVFFAIYNFSAVDIAVFFLNPLLIYIFIFLFGAIIFSIGLYFIKNFLKIQKSDIPTRIPSFLSNGNRILSSIGIVYSLIVILIIGEGINWIFLLHWNWFTWGYPPDPYSWEYMGFFLGILSIFIFILIYGIQYYIRLNWYIKKHSEIKRMKFNNLKKFIAPIFAIIAIIIIFFPLPYLGIAFSITFIIAEYLPIGYWDFYTIFYSLIFWALFILIGVLIFLSPRRKYELVKLV